SDSNQSRLRRGRARRQRSAVRQLPPWLESGSGTRGWAASGRRDWNLAGSRRRRAASRACAWNLTGTGWRRRVASRSGSAVRFLATQAELLGGQHVIGPVIVHPVEVLPPRVDDAHRVPGRHGLLLDDRHLGRVDLVNVVEAHHDVIGHALRVGRLLCAESESDHRKGLSVMPYARSSSYLPGFMMLFGSSAALIFIITSKPPPISTGTSSASPSRVAPWQAVMDPPWSSATWAISRLQLTQSRQCSSFICCSQMPMSISVRLSPPGL